MFDYTGISSGISYANNMNYGKFPEAVYINDVFSTYDIKGIGEKNIQRIFMLSQFDETNVVNEEFRKRILEEKNTV